MRQQILQKVSPQVIFFIKEKTGTIKGRARKLKSSVGEITITEKQASRLHLPSPCRISPFLEKCCLRISANESYQNAELELEIFMGVTIGHTTLYRLLQRTEFSPPDAQ